MKSETSLVGTSGRVELYSHSVVDLHLALVIYPGNSEQDLTLGCGQYLKQGFLTILFLMSLDNNAEGLQHFLNSLMEFGLSGILCYDTLVNFIYV
jgi:hypothetical protein